jgi:hypothetical protein
MDFFLINKQELSALIGLPHIQQSTYLLGIKPYIDQKTMVVGLKRRISYQSLSECLYIEPHPGIKSGSPSRQQLRRVIKSLERVGLVEIISYDRHLVLKCLLAASSYSVQNKADTKPTHHAGISKSKEDLVPISPTTNFQQEANPDKSIKADTPLIKDNYLYIFLQQKFEQFWSAYPEKKSRAEAWQTFQLLNPDDGLFSKIMSALNVQIQHHQNKRVQGVWVPPWKYPANWLSKRAWEDEVIMEKKQEILDAARRQNTRNESGRDPFWTQDLERETPRTNVIEFKAR